MNNRRSFDAVYRKYRPLLSGIVSDNGGPWQPVFTPKQQVQALRVRRMWAKAGL